MDILDTVLPTTHLFIAKFLSFFFISPSSPALEGLNPWHQWHISPEVLDQSKETCSPATLQLHLSSSNSTDLQHGCREHRLSHNAMTTLQETTVQSFETVHLPSHRYKANAVKMAQVKLSASSHEVIWGGEGIAPPFSFMLWPLCPQYPLYRTLGGPQSQCGCYGEEKSLHCRALKLGHPAHSPSLYRLCQANIMQHWVGNQLPFYQLKSS